MLKDILSERALAYASTLAALGAWWICWRETRRNNKAILRLSSLHSYFSEFGTSYQYRFDVCIQNRGMQLADVSMKLSFRERGGSGVFLIPLQLAPASRGISQAFLRGTTAMFSLSSVDPEALAGLKALHDIKEQRPFLCLYNSSFLVCSIPIWSRWDSLRLLWNRVTSRFIYQRRVAEGVEGKGVYRTYMLPLFNIRSEKLRFFLSGQIETNRAKPIAA